MTEDGRPKTVNPNQGSTRLIHVEKSRYRRLSTVIGRCRNAAEAWWLSEAEAWWQSEAKA